MSTGHIGAPGSIAREVTSGTYTIKQLWDNACKHDRIPSTSRFVVFSERNPWAAKYNFAVRCALACSK